MSSIVADVRRSVRFIRQHAKEYGVDPSRLGVFGNSAGGHLALLLASNAGGFAAATSRLPLIPYGDRSAMQAEIRS